MDMEPEVLDLLVCPVCLAALAGGDGQWLCCKGCGRRYPIEDGIPVLLAARAANAPAREP